MRKLLLFVSLVLVVSCGGSDGGGDVAAPNSSGYPNVIGTYAFNTSVFNWSCDDGSAGVNPAISFNVGVAQSINSLAFQNKNTGGSPGVTILESTGMTGNIDKGGNFTASENATATVDGIAGIVYVTWNISGHITSTGWSGNYQYSVSTVSVDCLYSATFTGDKVSASASLYVPDNYEPSQSIGMSVGN